MGACPPLCKGGEATRLGPPLGRYFPDIIDAARHLPTQKFVFDGELSSPASRSTTLQLRRHLAESRVRLLSRDLTDSGFAIAAFATEEPNNTSDVIALDQEEAGMSKKTSSDEMIPQADKQAHTEIAERVGQDSGKQP